MVSDAPPDPPGRAAGRAGASAAGPTGRVAGRDELLGALGDLIRIVDKRGNQRSMLRWLHGLRRQLDAGPGEFHDTIVALRRALPDIYEQLTGNGTDFSAHEPVAVLYRLLAEDISGHSAPRLAIDIRGAEKRFGSRTAVDGLTVAVACGEIFGLLGPNGSGKTTTVNLLSGLTRLTAGQIRIFGHDIATNARSIRGILGSVPQETALYDELTAVHNLRLHADLYFVPISVRERRINDALTLVQLGDRRDSRVGTFSGGMKRRLALARALLHEPDLIILDEPTLGVDIQSRRALWDRILELRANGKTIVITTNYLEEADALCDRIGIMDHGRLVALDTPQALRTHFGTSTIDLVTATAPSQVFLEQLRAVDGVLGVDGSERLITVTVDGRSKTAGEVVTAVALACGVQSLKQREATLDSVFLALTGRTVRDSGG